MLLYTLFDLLSESSFKIFKVLLTSAKISDTELAIFNLSSQSLTQASSRVRRAIAPLPTLGSSHEQMKGQHQFVEGRKQNYNMLRFCLKILSAHVQLMQNDLLAFIAHQEKIAHLRAAIREHRLKMAAEKRQEQVQIYLDEIYKLEIQMLEEINRGKAEASHFYDDLIVIQQNLTENMTKIKQQKHEALAEYTQNYAESLDHYASPSGAEYFKMLSSKERQAFLKDFFYEDRKLDKAIKKEKRKQGEIESELDKLFAQRRHILHQLVITELQGRINVNQTADSLKPMRITMMHGMERQGLKDERVRGIDDKIRALSAELKGSVDKVSVIQNQKEQLLTKVARAHGLEPLANASKEEQAHFLAFCSVDQAKIYAEMDKWSNLRQKHKRQKEQIQKSRSDLESEYNFKMKEGAGCAQYLNQTKIGEVNPSMREKVQALTKESLALDKVWQAHLAVKKEERASQNVMRDLRFKH